MRRARQVLAVALVATALCADRAATAAPALRPQSIERAGGIVQRLTARLSRVVSTVKIVEIRREGTATIIQKRFVSALRTADLRPCLRFGPALFPTPPPVL